MCFSRYDNITHISLEPACTACTNMVYSKELERDVTTTTKALLCLKTLALFLIEHDRFKFFMWEGRIRAVMYMSCVKS